MNTSKLRISLFRLHALLGLNLFLVLGLIFLSGTLLMFIWEIEASYTKEIRVNQPTAGHSATVGQIYDSIKTYDASLLPVYFERSETSWLGDKTFTRTSGGREIYVWSNPETAEILGTTSTSSLRKILYELHINIMTGHRIGALIASGFSVVVLFFIISGLLAYRKFWKGFFRAPPKNKGARAWWGGVHRLAALWVFPFLLLMAVTGFYYFVATLGVLHNKAPQASPPINRSSIYPERFDGAALDRAIEAAHEIMPELEITLVDLPFSRSHGIVVFGNTGASLVTPRANSVTVDPVTFEILGHFRAEDLSTGQRLSEIVSSLHTGIWGSLYSRLLWLGFGTIATFLTIAGAMVYASRVSNAPDMQSRSTACRIWRGMSHFKWGLMFYLLAIAALAIIRFGGF